jgi:acid phosphatase
MSRFKRPYSVHTLWLLALPLLAALGLACGGGPSPIQTPVPPSQPKFSHVVIVVEENHGFSEVIGNSAMTYFNGLAQQYGLAAQYFGNAHPSLPNYVMLTTGVIPPEAMTNSFSGTLTNDNIARELDKAGISWKCYAESLPSKGYIGPDVFPYLRHHNPFTYFSDTQGTPQASNIVSFSPQFSSDLASTSLPQFSFIVPNVLDDAHDGSLAQADAWLQKNIDPLIHNPSFQSSGLLIITFDEGAQSDLTNGGGHVATVLVSSKSKKNYVSQTFFQHQSTLRLALASLGVNQFPGASAVAPDMTEFFTGP